MISQVSSVFEIEGWDEQPFDEGPGNAKLTRASVAKQYAGDVEGASVTEWLMAYQPDGSAVFVGLERIKGTVGGRLGSLVLQHVGRFEDGAAKAELTILSGTDELHGAKGSGALVADPSGRITLSVEL
jgi:hypothetical protein